MKNNLSRFWVLLFCISLGCTDAVEIPDGDCPEEVEAPYVCDAVYDPVCGCNGKTYGSECEAIISGIDNYVKGECP